MNRLSIILALAATLPMIAAQIVLRGDTRGPHQDAAITFPKGTSTPSEECGACHQAIYREFATGFGSDLKFRKIVYRSLNDKVLTMPAGVSSASTAHSASGIDPFPIHARQVEETGRSCNTCHFPQAFGLPEMDDLQINKPVARPKGEEKNGLTCASCHLTPDGKIRGPYETDSPHASIREPKMESALMCAYCHAMGKRVVGKQTQTFLEWREDFSKPGLGPQQCQDCHMPHTIRKSAEDFDVPPRVVARHLWTGGHSTQRLQSALSAVVVQSDAGKPGFSFHVINLGAGHSVPTGSNRRAVYLLATALDSHGKPIVTKEWMFAPSYGDRPDDRKYLAEDKKRLDAVAALQADAQGPHETSIRAGEERTLLWKPTLKAGIYTIRARLVYDLNRYNDRAFVDDQTEIYRTSLPVRVQGGR